MWTQIVPSQNPGYSPVAPSQSAAWASVVPSPGSPWQDLNDWILYTGLWNDQGTWEDAALWIDSGNLVWSPISPPTSTLWQTVAA